MKKIGIFIVLLLLFVIPFTSAISTTLRDSYDKKETIIAEIKGNILSPINFGDIEFKRRNVGVPLDYGVENIEDKHFVWAVAPDNNGTYTLNVNNIETTVNGVNQIINYTQNFTVSENLTEYSVTPGVINTKKNFIVEITSYLDSDNVVHVNFPHENDITVKPGKNSFTFSIDSVKETLFAGINIGKYDVPLYVPIENKNVFYRQSGIYFEPTNIKRSIVVGDRPIYIVTIRNPENRSYQNVVFNYDKKLFYISDDKPFSIVSGGRRDFNLTFKNAINKEFSNQIEIDYDNRTVFLPLEIAIADKSSDVNMNQSTVFQYFCSELAGTKCSIDQTCSGETKDGLDGACCLGTCQAVVVQSSGSSTSQIIGYILAVAIFLIIGYLIYKFKKTKKEVGDDIEEKLGPSRLSKMKAAGMVEDKRRDLP